MIKIDAHDKAWIVMVSDCDSEYPIIVKHNGVSKAEFLQEFKELFPDKVLSPEGINDEFEVEVFTLGK